MMMSERTLMQVVAVKPRFIGGTLRVNRGYSGPIMQVYNGTTTRDVGSMNDVPAFCGSADGTVAILYDQSGNGRNYSQPTTTQRPKIYDGATTTLLRTNPRGPTVMRFDGVDDVLSRTDACGLSGDVGISVYVLAKVNGAHGSNISSSYCHFGSNLANACFDITFVSNLGGTSGADFSRTGINFTGNMHFDDGAGGAISRAFHYDVVERNPGDDILNIQWRLNGVNLPSANEILTGVGPSFNNLGSDIGMRAVGAPPLNGDLAMLAMWSPRLTTADRAALQTFSEVWRVQ